MGRIKNNLNKMAKKASGKASTSRAPARAAKKAAPKKRRTETFSIYIYRVLKQVHPETGISKRSMSIMNSFINDVFQKIATESSRLVRYNKKHTLSSFPESLPSTPLLRAPRPSPSSHLEQLALSEE